VPRSFEIGVANSIKRLRAGIARAVPAFLGEALQRTLDNDRDHLNSGLRSACFLSSMFGFITHRRYREAIKER
jgi:hypothetical protein